MNKILGFFDNLLSAIPFNGDKTVLGTALVAISSQPELVAIPQLAVPLHAIGIIGMLIGLVHKGIKLVSK